MDGPKVPTSWIKKLMGMSTVSLLSNPEYFFYRLNSWHLGLAYLKQTITNFKFDNYRLINTMLSTGLAD